MKVNYTKLFVLFLSMSCFVMAQGIEITQGPNMVTARVGAKGTKLADGRVALFGGHGPGFITMNSAEVWNPSTNTFTQYATNDYRDFCGLVRMNDGKYLLIGGMSSNLGVGQLASMELFNPVNNTFTSTGNMTVVRTMARGAQLTSGKVLIAGCWYDQGAASVGDVYDPVSNTCTQTNPLLQARANPMIIPMNDGTALLMGGWGVYGGVIDQNVEIYNPATNSFTLFKDELFSEDSGYIPYTHLGEIYQDYKLQNGKYLLLAYKNHATGTTYRLFTVDPQTKEIAMVHTNPEIPEYTNSTGGLTFVGYHLLDTLRNRVYLSCGTTGDTYTLFSISTVNLNNNNLTIGTPVYLSSYPYFDTPETLLPDGRIFIAGGSISNNFDPVDSSRFVKPIYTDIEGVEIPSQFSLEQNYPNPFNPATTIKFSIAERTNVKLTVYDNLGREVKCLVNGEKEAGNYEVSFESRSLSSGVYFYRIEAGSFSAVKKAVYLK